VSVVWVILLLHWAFVAVGNEYEIIRGAPDPEFCYPAGSGSIPDPDMSDPDPKWIQTSTTADNWRKITLSGPLLEKLE